VERRGLLKSPPEKGYCNLAFNLAYKSTAHCGCGINHHPTNKPITAPNNMSTIVPPLD